MRIPAASCTAVRETVSGPRQHARWLGASATALYLITESSAVLAVVTQDAVRLPCALVVGQASTARALSMLAPPVADLPVNGATVGRNEITWHADGEITAHLAAHLAADVTADITADITIAAVREWAPARVHSAGPLLMPLPCAVARAAATIATTDLGIDRELVAALVTGAARDPRQAIAALLGLGPGLTPSGDDVLAGFVLGRRAVGRRDTLLEASVGHLAAAATTALSAALLRHALRGECIREVVSFVQALCGRGDVDAATAGLIAVGHTSGAALASGVLAAAAMDDPAAVGAAAGVAA
jgi:uncharacterized protein DUF2877